jgi:hypothetical protein
VHHADKTVDKEIEIFEETQEAQVHDHAKNKVHPPSALFFCSPNQLTEVVIHEGGDHDEAKKADIPPAVKYVAGNQDPPQTVVSFGKEIDREKDTAEYQECNAVEYHPGLTCWVLIRVNRPQSKANQSIPERGAVPGPQGQPVNYPVKRQNKKKYYIVRPTDML